MGEEHQCDFKPGGEQVSKDDRDRYHGLHKRLIYCPRSDRTLTLWTATLLLMEAIVAQPGQGPLFLASVTLHPWQATVCHEAVSAGLRGCSTTFCP